MNLSTRLGALAALTFCATLALAQTNADKHTDHHAPNAGAPAAAPHSPAGDEHASAAMSSMREKMKSMQELMNSISATKDPVERRKLMEQHQKAMRDAMGVMRDMRMSADQMTKDDAPSSGGAMMGHDMMKRHELMQDRMDMMQMMMDQMLQHQAMQEGSSARKP